MRFLPLLAAVLVFVLSGCSSAQKERLHRDGKAVLRAGESLAIEVAKAELKALIEEELK